MTDFAAVYHDRLNRGDAVIESVEHSAIYLALAICYVLTAAVSSAQLIRLTLIASHRRHALMVFEHVLVLLVSVFRIMSLVLYYLLQYGSIESGAGVDSSVLGAVVALPYLVVFAVYTTLIFLWTTLIQVTGTLDTLSAATATRAAATATATTAADSASAPVADARPSVDTAAPVSVVVRQAFAGVRTGLIAANVTVSIIIVALFAALSQLPNPDSSSTENESGTAYQQTVAIAGTCIIACMSLDIGFSFALNGSQLLTAVRAGGAPTHVYRMLRVAVSISVAFIASGILLFVVAIMIDKFESYTAIFAGLYYCLDLFGLLCVLALFSSTIRDGMVHRAHDRANDRYRDSNAVSPATATAAAGGSSQSLALTIRPAAITVGAAPANGSVRGNSMRPPTTPPHHHPNGSGGSGTYPAAAAAGGESVSRKYNGFISSQIARSAGTGAGASGKGQSTSRLIKVGGAGGGDRLIAGATSPYAQQPSPPSTVPPQPSFGQPTSGGVENHSPFGVTTPTGAGGGGMFRSRSEHQTSTLTGTIASSANPNPNPNPNPASAAMAGSGGVRRSPRSVTGPTPKRHTGSSTFMAQVSSRQLQQPPTN